MQQSFTAKIDADPGRLFALVSDLGTYDQWLDIVTRVEPDGHDPDPAWLVTLRATLGPLARSKRLRMVRTSNEAPLAVRFERREHDGRQHSPWVLESTVEPSGGGCSSLTMTLRYGGRFWSPVLRSVLDAQVAGAVARLESLAAAAQP